MLASARHVIARSPATFYVRYRRHFRRWSAMAAQAPAGSDLERLTEDGVVVLHDLHDPADVAEAGDALLPMAERVRTGDPDPAWTVLAHENDGIYRIDAPDRLVPAAGRLVRHPVTSELVRRYLMSARPLEDVCLDYKPDADLFDDTVVPHMDKWRSQVKVFTLLCDVGPENAPLVYWKRSHRPERWRLWPDYLIHANTDFGKGGVCPPDVLRPRVDAGQLEEATITGRAGDVVVMDARGFHRASNLRAGHRLQLVEKYWL